MPNSLMAGTLIEIIKSTTQYFKGSTGFFLYVCPAHGNTKENANKVILDVPCDRNLISCLNGYLSSKKYSISEANATQTKNGYKGRIEFHSKNINLKDVVNLIKDFYKEYIKVAI